MDAMKNVEKNAMYICAVCGKGHMTVEERMNCEKACLEHQEEEAKAKKIAEYDARANEVHEAFDKAYDLRNKLIEDYGMPYVYPRRKHESYSPYILLSHFI